MDSTQFIFVLLAILFIAVATVKVVRSFYLLICQLFNWQPIYRELRPEYRPYLNQYFKFYRNLDIENKRLFEKRVQFFIDIKTFIPRGGLRMVSSEVKAIIAGSAIQITFGYPNVYFRHFSKILVYPTQYMNQLTHHYHKGEVNVKGLIVLSVDNLKKGWNDDADGINLGLHEMSHALSIENMVHNNEFNFIDSESIKQLKEYALPEMDKINQGGDSLFRKYGATNFREFFAVATEVFFELPDSFKLYHPQMFGLMTKVLNINPLDYKG